VTGRGAFARSHAVDAIALLVIAAVMTATRAPLAHYGMPLNDASWFFHFGRRALHGDVPFRDYVFQVGPLPIYVDAAFQKIFGSTYTSSLYAGMFVAIARVCVMWLVARRLAGWRCAALVCTFFAFHESFGFAHHWSWGYAELFIALAALFVIAARDAAPRRALVYLALAGFSAGLVVSARQATVVVVALVLAATSFARRDLFARRQLVVLWLGFAGAFVVVFGALAVAGAAGPAIQQMFLDAPQKKDVAGLAAVLDAFTGGAIYQAPLAWWQGLLRSFALPCLAGGAVTWVAARDARLSARAIAVLAVPLAIAVALITRDAGLDLYVDAPRMLFTITTGLALVAPDRLRRWFGVEPLIAIALGGLPLASEWALEMSYIGPGWDDIPALIAGLLLFVLASSRASPRLKLALCAAFAVVGLLHAGLTLASGYSPFENLEASDGPLAAQRFELDDPVLADHEIPEGRYRALAWLRREVPPGSTCFQYGTMAALYDVLDCRNPTRLDVTIPDFMTARDAADAVAALRAHPPDFILAHDTAWMNPPVDLDLQGKLESYGGLNPRAARELHVGLHDLLDRYESLGRVSDAIGPELAAEASSWVHWDNLPALHLYRRKR